MEPIFRFNADQSVKPKPRYRWLSAIAALLIVGVLISGLTAMLYMVRQGKNTLLANSNGTPGATVPNNLTTTTPSQTEVLPTFPMTPNGPVGNVVFTYKDQKNCFSFTSVGWSPDGKRIASTCDGEVRVWDALTGKNAVIYSSPNTVTSINISRWSPDGKHIASATGVIHIWDPGTGRDILTGPKENLTNTGNKMSANILQNLKPQRPQSGSAGIRALDWSPDSKYIASGSPDSSDGFVRIWDANNGKIIKTLACPQLTYTTKIAWSPDGKYIAASADNVYTCVWDVATKNLLVSYQGLGDPVWSPDSQKLAVTLGAPYLSVRVMEALTGKELFTMPRNTDASIWAPVWSHDGTHIATRHMTYTQNGMPEVHIQIWDMKTGKNLFIYTNKGPTFVGTMNWSPDDTFIASATSWVSGAGAPPEPLVVQVWVAPPRG